MQWLKAKTEEEFKELVSTTLTNLKVVFHFGGPTFLGGAMREKEFAALPKSVTTVCHCECRKLLSGAVVMVHSRVERWRGRACIKCRSFSVRAAVRQAPSRKTPCSLPGTPLILSILTLPFSLFLSLISRCRLRRRGHRRCYRSQHSSLSHSRCCG